MLYRFHGFHDAHAAVPAGVKNGSKYWTVKQAAGEIGMSVQWLYLKIKDGNGPPYKKRGRKILMLQADVLEWDENRNIP